jgi:thioredoxin reductase (NADPH)
MTEATACTDKEVYIVGGGNSAGQAAMYLSKFAKNVYIIIRKEDLTSTMSAYLIDQIDGTPNIHVTPKSRNCRSTRWRPAAGAGYLPM